MKAIIQIEMDNTAFDTDPGIELARILNKLARLADNQWDRLIDFGEVKAMDINGNTVGKLEIVP